jgi:hypothetical protein
VKILQNRPRNWKDRLNLIKYYRDNLYKSWICNKMY